MIAAGDLTERLTLLRPTLATDPIGGQTEGVATELGTFFAAIEPLYGAELLRAQQVTASLTHRIRLRVRDVKPSDRARYTRGGVTHALEVLQVVPVDRDELHLMCAEELT